MRCEMALGQMLEADSTALRGMDGSQLARHIGRCSGCARVAATLLDETGAVDRALTDYAEARAADASADAALEAIRAEAGVGPSTHPGDRAAGPGTLGFHSRPPQRWRQCWCSAGTRSRSPGTRPPTARASNPVCP